MRDHSSLLDANLELILWQPRPKADTDAAVQFLKDTLDNAALPIRCVPNSNVE